MADLEDVTLDGRPLHSLRVADLKAALEERGLPKSGQKNALIKRLKGALMLENLQRTSTPHIGLQPNSQIGEEMSQNSFIKQYLAKQQELLRQRLEREAREAVETDDQEDHTAVNNSTSCPAPAQDVAPVLVDQHKLLGPSDGEGLAGPANEGEGNRHQEANMSSPPVSALATHAPGSVGMHVAGGEPRPERVPTSSQVPADSDDEDSEEGEEDGEDEDWDSGARRRSLGEPARGPVARERSGASRQPPQHIPPLLSPQLRQPTPPPSPPPELSFPLPDTPKQSPPSPDVPPARQRTSSTSSSGSSSSRSSSSSPEPERSGHAERKPGPLTLLARKMASEGAFSGAGWHGRDGDAERQGNSSATAAQFPGRGPPEGTVSAIAHTANTAANVPLPMIPGTNQGVIGAHVSHSQVPVSVLRATATEERDREREAQLERERVLEQERLRALELERQERQRILEEEQEREKALERERIEREKALQREREERERALAKEREEREQALARERALELEREKELERQRALEQERALQLEKAKALEREQVERERLEREREEKARMERERAMALERERKERERALELERLEKEREEKERKERERALELERLEKEREEKERKERERALEQERIERERALEREAALERERLEKERVEMERRKKEEALEQERLERERALEQERKEREEKERALEQERKERALEQERKEREERERALEQERREREEKERKERERALEQERREREEKERKERERALEQERREREEKERKERERALEQERKEREEKERERALEQEREEKKKALERERLEKERALLQAKALQKEREEQERALEQDKERAKVAERERESHLPPSKRGREIGLTPLPTPAPLSMGPGRNVDQEQGGEAQGPMARRDSQPAESGTPISPAQATPLSPQSSFKKFRFLRESPVQPPSSTTSMVIKRPRTFSDSPQPQASPLTAPSKVGEQEQEGAQPSGSSGPRDSAGTRPEKESAVISTLVQSPQEKNAVSLASEDKSQADSMETEQQAAEESTKKAKEVDEGKVPSSPTGAALRRERDVKKQEKGARRGSSSSDSSSSDSDSGSSSSRSSGSSSSSQDKGRSTSSGRREGKLERASPPRHRVTAEAQVDESKEAPKASLRKRGMSVEEKDANVDGAIHSKKPFIGLPAEEEKKPKRKDNEGEEEKKDKPREVKETAMAEPEKVPETNEETPKAFTARRISLSSSKASPGSGNAEGEQESGGGAGRKRRWGSSTAVTAKKASISITTDSLKSLIPDIRPCPGQEAVVDLHPEEAVLSGAEDEERERPDQDLQIRRTVTQVVPSESQENGQKEAKRSRQEEVEEDDLRGDKERTRSHEEKMDGSLPGAMETQSPSHTSHDVEMNTVTPSDTLIRRSISQQKSGVSITIDDPVRTARQPSPPRGKVSNIVHVSNLVRPFTLGQLKELLGRTGTLLEEGFWIDKIKSHCYVTYSSSEEAVATRAALHGVKWPQSNPKVLNVDFCQQDELDFHKGLGTADKPGAEDQGAGTGRGRASVLPSLLPERDQWAEREREMERRERARAEREWDRDKVREFGKPGEEREGGPRRSRSRERRRKERGKSKEKKTDKKDKAAEEPPAKLLDDLFQKTKAAPCIYWLPLTEEQYAQREAARAERMKEREKRRKEQQEEEEKKKEEERKERMKAGSGATGDRGEGEKDKDRDRERDRDRDRGRDRDRDRENDKRRDGYRRPGGSSAGGGRRSRSRSDPRDRRR
ncbi:uncharacterized protein acin1a [Polymixia lowei]